ncbi:MAG TPA: hydrogenase formation protein HypD [Steroidobacteraceae bacterium]|nr:hydrogenase formation protein HypD [Steroidobacteraceae bacterium]
MTHASVTAAQWLERIRALPLTRPVKILNVCGGHERSISAAGLRAALPRQIELIPGPGCPVCICPEEDIHEAIQIARRESVTVVAYGDMLRVPVNAPRSEPRSLEQAKAAGADVRPIASPLDAVRIARANAGRPVVFLAAGFETTTAPCAAMLAQGAPENLHVLLSGRRTWPIVAQLLESGTAAFDALVAPGHVATVMGPEEWEFVATRHGLPAAIAGFTPDTLLAATYSVLRQLQQGRSFLDNCYGRAVRPGGNRAARHFLERVMSVADANWRGIGVVPQSGFELKPEYAAHDARVRFPGYRDLARKRAGQMPPGCDCAQVVLGRIRPNECRLYGVACTPHHPIGPCMVSDEGACRIWWASGVREPAHPPRRAAAG